MISKTDFQVVIAGAGPAGALLARELASAGISVALCDIKPEGALGNNWSDAIEKSALMAAGFQLPGEENGRYRGQMVKTGENDDNLFEPHAIRTLQIWAPDLSCRMKTDAYFDYILTDRRALSRILAEQAWKAGARIFYKHRVDRIIGETDVEMGHADVTGLSVTDLATGSAFDITAKIVVDATGHAARLRTNVADDRAINRVFANDDIAYAARTVRRLDTTYADREAFADKVRYGAYKGYFWTYRHSGDVIEVGGGVRREPGGIDPRTVINDMISRNPAITDTELRGGSGTVLVGISPFSLAAKGFLAVGDAAGQVIPTNGCGAGGAMTGALLAANTIRAALHNGDRGIDALWPYNRKWFTGRGSHAAALWTLKSVFFTLTHADFAFLIKKEIMNARLINPGIHGLFEAPDLMTINRSVVKGFFRPDLLKILTHALHLANRVFHHYREYPAKWDPAKFKEWTREAERLWAKVG